MHCQSCKKSFKKRSELLVHSSVCGSGALHYNRYSILDQSLSDSDVDSPADDTDDDPNWNPSLTQSSPPSSPLTEEQVQVASEVQSLLLDEEYIPSTSCLKNSGTGTTNELQRPFPDKKGVEISEETQEKNNLTDKLANVQKQIEEWRKKRKEANKQNCKNIVRRLTKKIKTSESELENIIRADIRHGDFTHEEQPTESGLNSGSDVQHSQEGRSLALHSPDGVHSCVLRAADSQEAVTWFNTLHSALHLLTLKALHEANRTLASLALELHHIGWLSRRQVLENGRGSVESGDDGERWQTVFGAVTQRELRFYESAPWSLEAWSSPIETCPLLSTRLVSSSKQSDVITFSVRCGTPEGVLTQQLRAETHRDLALWAQSLVSGCHTSVSLQQQLACRCVWQGQLCQLVLHYEDGFSLLEAAGPARDPKALWTFPFEKLRSSADDGARLLWLDFGADDEIELDLESCPKPLVFILHNFLSAKIHRLGLYA